MSKTKGRKTQYRGVKALGDGRYRLRVYVSDPVTGRRKEAVKTVEANNAKDANRLKELEQLRVMKMLDGEPATEDWSDSMPFGELANVWLDEVTTRTLDDDPTQPHLCPNTRERYEQSVRLMLKPFFGPMKAGRITVDHVRRWRRDLLEAGYARSTVNGHHRVLKSILRRVGNEAAHQVRALNEKPDARINRKEPNLLTADELDRFLEVTRERWPQHYALILVLLTTTVRIATALALRWEDLDLDTMEIVVRRRLSGPGRRAEVVPGVKRDRHGEDVPPLLPEVLEALEAHRATFDEAQRVSGLLFPSRDGRHHSRTVLAKPFADICRHAGITQRFTPHGCRRTGAKLYGRTSGTRMAMNIAGHMTESMHAHYAPVDASEKLAAGRLAFAGLRVLRGRKAGSEDESGTQTGTPSSKKERGAV